jgi:site-specific DNA recombinase
MRGWWSDMARTKDRYLKVLRHPYEPVVLLRKYRAAGYLRLSEDSERKQSDSIENQRYMINRYAKEHEDIEIVMFFEDDGFTGTNFHRSGFEQMMDAVRNGEIDCIIVKDVSRFGREHIQVGDYIDKVFPFLGVRFISIMDYYDSINPDCDRERMILSIKSLVHEMYPRDISRKVHSTFRAKRERGEVRRSNGIPYGFYMEAGDTSYRIDYKTYRIYKKIVGWYVAGCALKDIVRLLFKRGILTPSQYRKTGLVYQNDTVKANIWVESAIWWMLRNPVYEGTLELHKTEQILYENIAQRSLPREEYLVFENAHPKILSHERFVWLQEIIAQRETKSEKEDLPLWQSMEEKVFSGILFCGDCMGRMKRRSQRKMVDGKRYRIYGYVCAQNERMNKICSYRWIWESDLCEIVVVSLRTRLLQMDGLDQQIQKFHRETYHRVIEGMEKELHLVRHRQQKLESERIDQYTAYLERRADITTFELFRAGYAEKRARLDKQEADLIEQMESLKKLEQVQVRMVREFLCFKKQILSSRKKAYQLLTTELIHTFVKQIFVYQDKRVEIIFKFEDEMQYLMGKIASLCEGRASA